jgi:hypothetical protein
MTKITFVNGTTPAVNATNLNQMQTNIENAINALNPVVLYNNTSGTTGTVTLSETAANFQYLEIFFDAYGYKSVRVFSPNGKNALLQGITYADTLYHLWKNVLISETSITVSNEYRVAVYNDTVAVQQNTNQVKIYRVLGYR